MTNGIRVAKPGYQIETASPKQLVFSSEYKTFRVQQQGSGTLTNSGGRSVTIPHNLGYVPVFLVHGTLSGGSDYYILPSTDTGTIITPTKSTAWATADSTNLYINVDSSFGYFFAYANNENDMATRGDEGSGPYYGFAAMGESSAGTENWSGCLRFESLFAQQGASLAEARVFYKVDQREGTGDIRIRIKGIKETNTNIFSSADDPFNRTETTTEITKTIGSGAQAGSTDEWVVTSIINEILGQVGWSSGNSLGIKMWDNNSDDNNSVNTTNGDSYLRILPSNTLLNYKYTIFKDKIE